MISLVLKVLLLTPPNAQDTWHGYPTNSQYIGDELVEHWYSINVISKGIYRKLLKHIL